MTLKQTGITLLVLAVLAVVAGVWASYSRPVAQEPAQVQDLLGGTATSTGQMEYRELSDCFDIDALYPASTGLSATADAKAREFIQTRLKHEIDQFKSDNDVSDRDPAQTKALGICTDRKFTLQLQYKQYVGQGMVSYFYTVYADSLGAHPNLYFITFTFDQNGKIVSIEDVLRSNDLSHLSQLVTADVTAQLKRRLKMDDVSGAIFNEGLTPNDNNYGNFVVDGSDLLVEIPPYQVAAWAAGTFEVRIPLSELQK